MSSPQSSSKKRAAQSNSVNSSNKRFSLPTALNDKENTPISQKPFAAVQSSRSGRTIVKPLQYWKNERILLVNETGSAVKAVVVEGLGTPQRSLSPAAAAPQVAKKKPCLSLKKTRLAKQADGYFYQFYKIEISREKRPFQIQMK